MAACDWVRLLHFKKIPTFYSVNIEAVKICQTKKKKDMLGSENQKQSFTDAFEYRCSWKFCKFHGKISVLESLLNKIAGLHINQKRPQHRCFPVKFVKFLRRPFFTEHLQWLLLENLFRPSRENRLPIPGKIYAVIWQRLPITGKIYAVIWVGLLLLLGQNVSSCSVWLPLILL